MTENNKQIKLNGIISSRIEEAYDDNIYYSNSLDDIEDRLSADELPLLSKQISVWRDNFLNHILDNENNNELKNNYIDKDPLYISEIWMRYLRRNIHEVIQYDEKEYKKYKLNIKKIYKVFNKAEK